MGEPVLIRGGESAAWYRMEKDLEQVTDEILFLMTGREKSIFANMDESDLPYVGSAFDGWLKGNVTDEADASRVIHAIWRKLEKTHRIRRIK